MTVMERSKGGKKGKEKRRKMNEEIKGGGETNLEEGRRTDLKKENRTEGRRKRINRREEVR